MHLGWRQHNIGHASSLVPAHRVACTGLLRTGCMQARGRCVMEIIWHTLCTARWRGRSRGMLDPTKKRRKVPLPTRRQQGAGAGPISGPPSAGVWLGSEEGRLLAEQASKEQRQAGSGVAGNHLHEPRTHSPNKMATKFPAAPMPAAGVSRSCKCAKASSGAMATITRRWAATIQPHQWWQPRRAAHPCAAGRAALAASMVPSLSWTAEVRGASGTVVHLNHAARVMAQVQRPKCATFMAQAQPGA